MPIPTIVLGKDQSGLGVAVRVARKAILNQYSREAVLPSFPVFLIVGKLGGQITPSPCAMLFAILTPPAPEPPAFVL